LLSEDLKEESYTIQIYSLKSFKKDIDIKSLDSIYIYKSEDSTYKYIFGLYPSEEAATPDLEKSKNLGFKDAFVLKVSRYKSCILVYKRKKSSSNLKN